MNTELILGCSVSSGLPNIETEKNVNPLCAHIFKNSQVIQTLASKLDQFQEYSHLPTFFSLWIFRREGKITIANCLFVGIAESPQLNYKHCILMNTL